MTDEECRDVYRQLVGMLNDRELLNANARQISRVAEEVSEVVRAGKVISEAIESSVRRSSRDFITTREYTSQEALLLLIDAIESVVVQTAFIEKEVTNFFRKEGEEFNISPEIRFASEEDSQTMIFDHRSSIGRAEQALTLRRLLEQLRLEVRE